MDERTPSVYGGRAVTMLSLARADGVRQSVEVGDEIAILVGMLPDTLYYGIGEGVGRTYPQVEHYHDSAAV